MLFFSSVVVFVNFLSPRYESRLYSLNNKSISDSLRPLENLWVGGRSPKINSCKLKDIHAPAGRGACSSRAGRAFGRAGQCMKAYMKY